MTDLPMKRREFLVGAGLSGLGLVFGLDLKLARGAATKVDTDGSGAGLKMAWVRIAPDGTITIMSPAADEGQGSMTALAVIFAEELDADWNKVAIEFSPADDNIYGNQTWWAHGLMITAGSSSISGYYQNLRIYGAQARRVLLDAAAAQLNVPVGELTTQPSMVVHAKSGQSLSYGAIASFAALPATLPTVSAKALKHPSQFRLIGHDIPRRDVPAKTDGSVEYSIDIRLPNMVYATVLRAPVVGATPISVNSDEVSRMPDVLKVMQLPPDRVAVAARTFEAALAGERALKIKWSSAPGDGFDSDAAFDRHSASARDLSQEGFALQKLGQTTAAGDILAVMNGAAKIYEAEYRTEFVYHAQMEPVNCVCSVKDGGQSVEVWTGTGTPTLVMRMVAGALGIAPEQVLVHRTQLGGGFGRAAGIESLLDSAVLSKEMGRPVKVIWSRESDVRFGRFKPMTVEYLRAGEDSNGQLTAWHYRMASDEVDTAGSNKPLAVRLAVKTQHVGVEIDYDIPNVLTEIVRNRVDARLSPVRGVGATINQFAIESFIDEIAVARGADPLELRLDLLRNEPPAQEVLRVVSDLAGWRKGEKTNRGLSFCSMEGTFLATVAEISVDRQTGEIRVPEIWIAIDVGIAISPRNLDAQIHGSAIYALSNALKERITFKKGAVEQSNFYDYPVLRMAEIPEVHIQIVPSGRDPVGVGDRAGVGVAPAVASAFFAATGRRLRQTPFLPERVLAALRA